MGTPSGTIDRLLGGLWLFTIVLLLMTRELSSPADNGLDLGLAWGFGWLGTLLVVALAGLAGGRLLDPGGRPAGAALAGLTVLYLPLHLAAFFDLLGDPVALFLFHTVFPTVLYPVMTVLALVAVLGRPVGAGDPGRAAGEG